MTATDWGSWGISLRRRAAVAAAVGLLAITAVGCGADGVPSSSGSDRAVPTAVAPAGQPIVLRFDEAEVPATLANTAAGREFAALLPLTLELRDPMGQAKSGLLPAPMTAAHADRVTDPDAGGIYYMPDSAQLAVFYDDLGQTVPAPGLILLGAVNGDLTSIAAAGNRARVQVDLADPNGP
jgi:hypothetical protein